MKWGSTPLTDPDRDAGCSEANGDGVAGGFSALSISRMPPRLLHKAQKLPHKLHNS